MTARALPLLLLLALGGCSNDDEPARDGSSSGGGSGATYTLGGSAGERVFLEVEDVMGEYITPDAACSTHDPTCLLPCPADDLYVAMNTRDYAGSETCGGCIEVTGPLGVVMVSVIEDCAGACQDGEIEVSETAFARIADVSEGRATVSWRLVPCEVTGPITFHFESESSEWWAGIQVRNHRIPVSGLALLYPDGAWQDLERQNHDHFEARGTIGPGPFDFRVTAIDGQVLLETGIPLEPGGVVPGSGQFE